MGEAMDWFGFVMMLAGYWFVYRVGKYRGEINTLLAWTQSLEAKNLDLEAKIRERKNGASNN